MAGNKGLGAAAENTTRPGSGGSVKYRTGGMDPHGERWIFPEVVGERRVPHSLPYRLARRRALAARARSRRLQTRGFELVVGASATSLHTTPRRRISCRVISASSPPYAHLISDPAWWRCHGGDQKKNATVLLDTAARLHHQRRTEKSVISMPADIETIVKFAGAIGSSGRL